MKKLVTVIVALALALSSVQSALADTIYIVQPGDWLSKIATRFGVTVQAILDANGLANPNLIFVGQRLVIPTGGGAAPTSAPPSTGNTGSSVYIVQSGDWLSRIATRFGVPMSAIMSANGITNPSLIFVGQRLVIPGQGASNPAPSTTTPAPSTPAPSTPAPASGGVYIVQPGDWLAKIAARFGVTTQAIMAANGITNPNRILVGQQLIIPGQGAPATATPAPSTQPTQPPATSVPPPSTGGGFELGGHVDTFAFPEKMMFAGMAWAKRQVRWSPGMAAGDFASMINDTHAKGFKILLGVVGHPGDISGGANYDAYAAFVGELARLGADGIEVWNEMNIDREWPAGQINPAAYTDLLRRAYSAIKGANANTLVISGAPAPTGAEGAFGLDRVWNDDRYVRGMAAAGAASYMDCLGIHYNEGIVSPVQTSGDPRNPSDFYSRYYQTMVSTYYNAFGGARKLCFTELGYLSPEGFGGLPSAFGWAADTSVAEQAQWLGEAANLAKNSGVVRLMIIWNVDFRLYGDDPMGGYSIVRPDASCRACDELRKVTGGR